MLKRKNKKGFTLAELLIVVAIIAVLVAIAVPLFVGALDNAKEQTFNANKRALKAAAAIALLEEANQTTLQGTGPWYATATFDEDGNMGPITWTGSTETEYSGTTTGEITVKLEKTDVTKSS